MAGLGLGLGLGHFYREPQSMKSDDCEESCRTVTCTIHYLRAKQIPGSDR